MNIPQANATESEAKESIILLLGVTQGPPGFPAMDSSNSINESILMPPEIIFSRSLL